LKWVLRRKMLDDSHSPLLELDSSFITSDHDTFDEFPGLDDSSTSSFLRKLQRRKRSVLLIVLFFGSLACAAGGITICVIFKDVDGTDMVDLTDWAEKIDSDTAEISGEVDEGEWRYYQMDLHEDVSERVLLYSTGGVTVYLSVAMLPTPTVYDFKLTGANNTQNPFLVCKKSSVILGVTADTKTSYKVSIKVVKGVVCFSHTLLLVMMGMALNVISGIFMGTWLCTVVIEYMKKRGWWNDDHNLSYAIQTCDFSSCRPPTSNPSVLN